jgi:nitrilase
LIAPLKGKEQLLVAEIDHREVLRERQNFDVAGHYARPDVTQLLVNRERQSIVKFED